MTTLEMLKEFDIRKDKVDSLSYPNFTQSEKLKILNLAIRRIVRTYYSGNNKKRESVEQTEKRRRDLNNLTINLRITPNSSTISNKKNGRFVVFPREGEKPWLILQEEVEIAIADCNGSETIETIEVRPITHDQYNEVIKNPFKKPNKRRVIKLPYKEGLELIGNGEYSLETYVARAIKEPTEISLSVDPELDSLLHDEIVDEAVKIGLEAIESPRLNTYQIIENTNE